MSTQQLHIDTVDAPNWHAVLIVEQRPRLDPEIVCVGFRTPDERDNWLSYFAPSVRNLAQTLPTVGPSLRTKRRATMRAEAA